MWKGGIASVRIVSWNIRAGGGTRAAAIGSQIERWAPDVVGLCEFRATPPSTGVAARLKEMGLVYQVSTADPAVPRRNSLLLAARFPLRTLALRRTPAEPGRWCMAMVGAGRPFIVGLMHVPVVATGRKVSFMEAVTAIATRWRHAPAVLLGDTNAGWPPLDEQRPTFGPQTVAWLDGLHALDWQDAFRQAHPGERTYTWYSQKQNGVRLDQAFLNPAMQPRLRAIKYEWGRTGAEEGRRDAVSDHAALILDLND